MNYYIDTEFLEGVQEPKWLILKSRLGHWMIGKPKPTIDLISIGIVSEDGREYYAVSKDFNLEEAWNRYDLKSMSSKGGIGDSRYKKVYWIRENVLKPIWIDFFLWYESEFAMLKGKAYDDFKFELESGEHDKLFTFKSFKALVNRYGKTNKEIAIEIQEFIYGFAIKGYDENKHQIETTKKLILNFKEKVKFYAYYADYDWVAFCWLFGKMIDLPNGFPMYCRDLKQIMDEKVESLNWGYIKHVNSSCNSIKEINSVITPEKDREASFEEKLSKIKSFIEYPKQENVHNALDDARWNKKLHEFLKINNCCGNCETLGCEK